MLSCSYASHLLSSAISLLQFQMFCNIFFYLICPSHSSINSLPVCPSWLLVFHSAKINYLYWCSLKSERVRRLLERPQASPVYRSFKKSHEDEDVCGEWVERCIKVKTEGLGGMCVPVSLCQQQILHSPSWGRFTVVSVRSRHKTAKKECKYVKSCFLLHLSVKKPVNEFCMGK